MAWKSRRYGSAAWRENSSEETAPTQHQAAHAKSYAPPDTAEGALWNVVRRCGGPYKWLKSDLFMLGVASDPENIAVVEAYSEFLRALGQRLLPQAGIKPLEKLQRARPEVQELSMLLACLATPAKVAQLGTSQHTSHQNHHDPWSKYSDPWQAKAHESSSPAIQYVTVEKIIERPFADPLRSEASTSTEDLIITPEVIEATTQTELEHCGNCALAPSCDAGMVTEPSPLYSVVNAEMRGA